MKTQPPNENNPSNPLFKAVALTLRTVDVKTVPLRTVRVVASLNFKKSNHMHGETRATDGSEVTVSFSLAIKRASFELSFKFEGKPHRFSSYIIV